MARRGDEFFCVDPVMIKREKGFVPGMMKLCPHRGGPFHFPDSDAATASNSFQKDGVAHFFSKSQNLADTILSQRQDTGPGNCDNLRLFHHRFDGRLVSQTTHHPSGRANKDQPVLLTGCCKIGTLGQESITGMNGISSRFAGRLYHFVDIEVILHGTLPNHDRGIGKTDKVRLAVRLFIHSNRLHTHGLGSFDNGECNLSTVGDQHFLNFSFHLQFICPSRFISRR